MRRKLVQLSVRRTAPPHEPLSYQSNSSKSIISQAASRVLSRTCIITAWLQNIRNRSSTPHTAQSDARPSKKHKHAGIRHSNSTQQHHRQKQTPLYHEAHLGGVVHALGRRDTEGAVSAEWDGAPMPGLLPISPRRLPVLPPLLLRWRCS